MRVDKVIWRSILSTLLAIVILLTILSCLLCWVFPSTMMDLTYKLGMNGESVKYAMRAYNQTGSVAYVAFATETAIVADNDKNVEECGLKLIADDEFAVYCAKRNEKLDTSNITYEQYVYGMVSTSQYRQGKKSQAQETAFVAVGNTFPKNNAVVGLLTTAIGVNDLVTVAEIKVQLQALQPNVTETADSAYLVEILQLCEK